MKPEKNNPVLLPGDIILLPGGLKYSFRDNLSFILSIASVLVSITLLIYTIAKK